MFDVGFWEIMFVVLIALVVVGPERLPKLAYTAGKWVGKGRSLLSSVKSEIDREIKAEELKEVLEKQKQSLNPLHDIVEETHEAVTDLHNTANERIGDSSERKPSLNDKKTTESTPDP